MARTECEFSPKIPLGLERWPRSWMGWERDLPPGEKMVDYFPPFIEHLITSGLSRKTIRKHIDNLWILGGEIIRDLNQTPSLRKQPVEQLVFELIQDGGPLLYHSDTEEQQRSFESICFKHPICSLVTHMLSKIR